MRIGELARAVGLTAITIRYYESVGLSPRPGRTSSNHRAQAFAKADTRHWPRG